jgi:hypothetical protein
MTDNESHGYPHADRDVVNAAVQDIRCQTQAGLFVEFDDGHDIWALILYPRLVVDGERVDATVSRHGLWRTPVAAANRALACGRVHIVIAVSTALNPESAVGPACPKELCVRVVDRSKAVDEWIVKNSSRRHLATVGHHPPIVSSISMMTRPVAFITRWVLCCRHSAPGAMFRVRSVAVRGMLKGGSEPVLLITARLSARDRGAATARRAAAGLKRGRTRVGECRVAGGSLTLRLPQIPA